VTSYKLWDGDDEVTESFTNVVTVNGELEVTPKALTITAGSISVKYDEQSHSTDVFTYSGEVSGQKVTATIGGSRTSVGDTPTTISAWDVKVDGVSVKSNYNVTLAEGNINIYINTTDLKVTAAALTTTYNGEAHSPSAAAVSIEGATVTYSTSGEVDTYTLTTPPEYTDAGAYTYYVKAEKTGYADATGTAIVTITPAEATLTIAKAGFTYNGTSGAAPQITTNSPAEPMITYYTASGNTPLPGAPVNAGDYRVVVTVEKTDNYSGATETVRYTIAKRNISLTITTDGAIYTGSEITRALTISAIAGTAGHHH
jgi:lipopolysaccharide export system protein LptA